MIRAWLKRSSRAIAVGSQFWGFLREHRFGLALVGGASLFAVVFELLKPWPIKFLFDAALAPVGEPSMSPGRVILLCGAAMAVIVLAQAGLNLFARLRQAAIGHAVTRSIRLAIFRRLTLLSPAFHARHKSGDLMVRLMGDVGMLRTMLVDSAVMVFTRLLLIAGTLTVMLILDPMLTGILLLVIPALVLVVRILSARLTTAVRKQRRKEGALADYLHEAIAAAGLIQSLGREHHTAKRFARNNRSSMRAGLKAARLGARLGASVESMLGLAVAATLMIGGWRALTASLTPGELLVFLSYVRSLLKPVRSAARHSEKIAKGTACGERILDILTERPVIRESAGTREPPAHPARLSYDGVHFSYHDSEEDGLGALHGLDLELRRGEFTGLYGASGAGKSTVAMLALRLFDPDRGAVRLDGTDLREFDLDAMRERFGFAMQETILFGESVRENLLLGRPDATDAELWAALDAAAADSFVRRMSGGLDAELGAAGAGLSGGERRRLCLARTLLRGAPILILDEPFNGLDAPAAEKVRATLRKVAEDAIVLVIAHDSEHLHLFHRIVYLEEGRVAAEGTHEELLRDCDAYVRAQFRRPRAAS